jgi:hypothetical protein
MIDTNALATSSFAALTEEIASLKAEMTTARENYFNLNSKFQSLRSGIRGFFSVYVDNNENDDEFEISLEDINAFLSVHGISEIEREYEWDVTADIRGSIVVRVTAPNEDLARGIVDGMDLEITSWESNNLEVDYIQIDVSEADRAPS